MNKNLVFLLLILGLLNYTPAQTVNKVLISGWGGQHDLDLKSAFYLGYSSYDSTEFKGEVILYSQSLQNSFEYAQQNDFEMILRSTTGLSVGLQLAPDYPLIKLVMPSGSNSFVQSYSGDIINSPVIITGAGVDSNITGYKIDFFSIDPITGSNLSNFSNGYIAAQIAFIANSLQCSLDSAKYLARSTGSNDGVFDFYSGFGKIMIERALGNALTVELSFFTDKFILNQNYPNPFNPSTKINYSISEISFVTIKVYNVLGSEVAILVNEENPVGSYKVEFDAKGLPSGIYFYKLQAGSFVETKKMVLLR